MKTKEIAGKKKEDLVKLLAEKREEVRKFGFDVAGAKARNVRTGRNARRDVARILTAINCAK